LSTGQEDVVSAYDLETILKKWERAELSAEQAIGQILLLLQGISKRIGRLEVEQAKNRHQEKPVEKPDKPDKK
jgi:hypothetical protein